MAIASLKESNRFDEGSIVYHSLRKVFILKETKLEEDEINRILSEYDDILGKQLVNLDTRYNKEECFIHRLARESHVQLLQHFVNIGCDVNVQSKDGNTASHFIVEIGDSDSTREMLEILYDNGADFSIQNQSGFSSVDLAGYRLSKFMQQLMSSKTNDNGNDDNNNNNEEKHSFNQDEILSTFNILDRTKNGLLSLAELRDTLNKLNFNISDDLLDYMFNLVDNSGDGQVSLDEFEQFVKQIINSSSNNKNKNKNTNDNDNSNKKHKISSISIDFIFESRKNNKNDKNYTLIDVDNIGKVLQRCEITNNFTKLNRLFKTYFCVESNNIHSYSNWERFYNAFKSKNVNKSHHELENDENKERKHKKRLKKIFYSFSEEHGKLVNGRLLFICLAGVAAQFSSEFMDKSQLTGLRGQFIFELLDVDQNGTIGLFELEWLLRAACIFEKNEDEVKRKALLLCTAAGAKGSNGKVTQQAFIEILERFPNIIFPKMML